MPENDARMPSAAFEGVDAEKYRQRLRNAATRRRRACMPDAFRVHEDALQSARGGFPVCFFIANL